MITFINTDDWNARQFLIQLTEMVAIIEGHPNSFPSKEFDEFYDQFVTGASLYYHSRNGHMKPVSRMTLINDTSQWQMTKAGQAQVESLML